MVCLMDHDCCLAQWPIQSHGSKAPQSVISCVLGFGSELAFELPSQQLQEYMGTGALRVQLLVGPQAFTGTVQWAGSSQQPRTAHKQTMHLLDPSGVHAFSLSVAFGVACAAAPDSSKQHQPTPHSSRKQNAVPADTAAYATYLPPSLLWSPSAHISPVVPPKLPRGGGHWVHAGPSQAPPVPEGRPSTHTTGTQTSLHDDHIRAVDDGGHSPASPSRASRGCEAGSPPTSPRLESKASSPAAQPRPRVQRRAQYAVAPSSTREGVRSSVGHRSALDALFQASVEMAPDVPPLPRHEAAPAVEMDWPLHGTHPAHAGWGTSSGTREAPTGKQSAAGGTAQGTAVSVKGRALLTTASMQATASHEAPVLHEHGVAVTGFGLGPTPAQLAGGDGAFPSWIRSYRGSVEGRAAGGSGLQLTGNVLDVTEIGQNLSEEIAYSDARDSSRLGSSIAFAHRRSVTLKGVLPAEAGGMALPTPQMPAADIPAGPPTAQRTDWHNAYVHTPVQPNSRAPLSAGASAVGTVIPNRMARTTRAQALRERAARDKLQAMAAAAEGRPPSRKRRQGRHNHPPPQSAPTHPAPAMAAPAVAGTPLHPPTAQWPSSVSKVQAAARGELPPRPHLPREAPTQQARRVLQGVPRVNADSRMRDSVMQRAWQGELPHVGVSTPRDRYEEMNTSYLTEASQLHEEGSGHGVYHIDLTHIDPKTGAVTSSAAATPSPTVQQGDIQRTSTPGSPSGPSGKVGSDGVQGGHPSVEMPTLSLADVFETTDAGDAGELLSSAVQRQDGFRPPQASQGPPNSQTALDVLSSPVENTSGTIRTKPSSVPSSPQGLGGGDTSWLDNYAPLGQDEQLLSVEGGGEDDASYASESFEEGSAGTSSAEVRPSRTPSGAPPLTATGAPPLRIDAMRGVAASHLIPSTLDSAEESVDSTSMSISDSMRSGAGGLSVDINAVAAGLGGARPWAAQVTPPGREDEEEPQAVMHPTPHAAAATPELWPSSRSEAGSVGRGDRVIGDPQTPSGGAQNNIRGGSAGSAQAMQRQLASFAPTAARAASGGGVFVKQRLHAKPIGAPPARLGLSLGGTSKRAAASPATPMLETSAAEGSFVDSLSESSFGEGHSSALALARAGPADDVEVDWSISVSQGGLAEAMGDAVRNPGVEGVPRSSLVRAAAVPQSYPPSVEGQGLSPRPGQGGDMSVPEMVRQRTTSALSSVELQTLEEVGDD